MISKETFLRCIDSLQAVEEFEGGVYQLIQNINSNHPQMYSDCGSLILPNCSGELVDLLSDVLNDETGLISYFCYDLRFGKDWEDEVKLSTAEELWDCLTLDGHGKALRAPWIPVTERLPKIGERVMVTVQHEFDEETVEITTYSKHGFYIQPVVAWMPLPESYKKEGE